MKKILLISVGVCLLLCSAFAEPAFTPDEWKRMKTGEIVVEEVSGLNPDGSQHMQFQAKLYTKASRRQIWRVLRDYNKFYEFFPNVVKTEVVKKEGEAYWVTYTTKVSFIKVNYTLKFTPVEKFKRINFELDKTRKNDIRETKGSWIFKDAPNDSGTVIIYSNYTDTGIPAPAKLARKAMMKSMPNVLGNVRKRVESNGKWKKPEGG